MEPTNIEEKPVERHNFITELRRRKVFRVAGTYAIVSWLIIQVAAATFSDFGIPTWAFRFVVMMVLLGFPVAIILAWAFELTPDGVRKSRRAPREQPLPEEAGLNRRRNWYAIGMAAALPTLIFGSLSLVFYLGKSDSEPAEVAEPTISAERPYVIGTLALLPFTIISEEPGIDVTAVGLHDEMLTVFSGMSPLDVISRTSTLRFGDFTAGIPEIGAALNADFVVEGSIQSIGQNLRLTLQLIEAATDNHIWAKSFDRDPGEAEDLIQFQKELAFELAIRVYQALEAAVPPTGPVKAIRDNRVDELEKQLEAQYINFWRQFWASDWLEQSQAIKATIAELARLDPVNKAAYDRLTGISWADTYLGMGDRDDPEWRKGIYLILKQSYAVHPDGFDVNKHLGLYYLQYENQPHRGIPYSRKAIRIEKANRGFVDVYTYSALLESLYETGQYAAALEIVEQAHKEGLTVFTGVTWFWSQAYVLNRQYEEALAFLDAKIEEVKTGTVAQQNDPEFVIFQYGFTKASIRAKWSADHRHLFDFIDQQEGNEAMPDMVRAYHAFFSGDFAEALNVMSGLQQESSPSTGILAELRGWIYLKSGNEALARSYFRGFLNELSESPRARWMERYSPDWFAAQQAYAHACLGNREEALSWSDKALEQADPSRNFEDYFKSLNKLASAFALVGETDRAIQLIDQILSSPSGHTTGDILLDFGLGSLHGLPAFQAVIRKHADQLKDPAILDRFFGSKS